MIRFRTPGKLKQRFLWPFPILDRIGSCAYRLAHYHKFFRLRATIGFNLRGKTDSHLGTGKQDTPEQGDPIGKGIVEKSEIKRSYVGDWTRDGQEIP